MAKRTLNLDTKDIEYILQFISKEDTPLAKKLKNALKTIKVSSRKGKGRGLQQWVCEQISEITGITYTQSDDQCEIHSRELGLNGIDVILRGSAFKKFPFSVECKNSESLNLVDTVTQARDNQVPGTSWLIVHRRKALPEDIVIMSWQNFKTLAKELQCRTE